MVRISSALGWKLCKSTPLSAKRTTLAFAGLSPKIFITQSYSGKIVVTIRGALLFPVSEEVFAFFEQP